MFFLSYPLYVRALSRAFFYSYLYYSLKEIPNLSSIFTVQLALKHGKILFRS